MRLRVTIKPSGNGGGEWTGILVLIATLALLGLCVWPMIHNVLFRGFVWDIIKLVGVLALIVLSVAGVIAVIALVIWLIFEFFGW